MKKNEFLNELHMSCDQMTDIVFQWYLDRKDEDIYFYYLIAECYKDIQSFCVLMNSACWTQAGMILRLSIEQISSFIVLAKNNNLIKDYNALFRKKRDYISLSKDEKNAYKKKYNLKSNHDVEQYFSYSWINSLCNGNYNRDRLVELADLSETLIDIKEIFNKFSHGDLSIFEFSKDNWGIMDKMGKRMFAICVSLFQRLYFYTIKYFNFDGDLPIDNIYEVSKSFYYPFKQ